MIFKVTDGMVRALVSQPMADLSETYYEVFDSGSAYGWQYWLDYVESLALEFVAYSKNGRLFVSHKNGRLYGYYGDFAIAWTLFSKHLERF